MTGSPARAFFVLVVPCLLLLPSLLPCSPASLPPSLPASLFIVHAEDHHIRCGPTEPSPTLQWLRSRKEEKACPADKARLATIPASERCVAPD